EAGAKMRAFDEAGEIGDDKRAAEFRAVPARAAIRIYNAKIWLERGERIVSDFGGSRRDDRDERGLARVRETDESNICEQLQLQAKMPLLAGKTIFMFARGLMPGLGEMLIAAAAAPTLRDQHALSRNGEISDGFAR